MHFTVLILSERNLFSSMCSTLWVNLRNKTQTIELIKGFKKKKSLSPKIHFILTPQGRKYILGVSSLFYIICQFSYNFRIIVKLSEWSNDNSLSANLERMERLVDFIHSIYYFVRLTAFTKQYIRSRSEHISGI